MDVPEMLTLARKLLLHCWLQGLRTTADVGGFKQPTIFTARASSLADHGPAKQPARAYSAHVARMKQAHENVADDARLLAKSKEIRKQEEADSESQSKGKKAKSQTIPPHEEQDREEVVFKPEIKHGTNAAPGLSINTAEQSQTAKVTTKSKSANRSKDHLKRKIMQIDVEKKQLEVRKLEAQKRLFALEHQQ